MRLVNTFITWFLLLAAGSVHAFVVSNQPPLRWDLIALPAVIPSNSVNRATAAIRYHVAADGYSPTNTEAEINAVRASFETWQSVTGTSLKFEYAGTVAPGIDLDPVDTTNAVFWANTYRLLYGGKIDLLGILGVCCFSASNNILSGADIALNGYQYQWFTDFNRTSSSAYFVEGTVTHEIGHFIGLDHSPIGSATLYAYNASGVSHQVGLATDDICGVRSLYGLTNPVAPYGFLQGVVQMNGSNISGALVSVEDANGHLASATLSLAEGTYALPMLTPGTYSVRATPLDYSGLVRPGQFAALAAIPSVVTAFLPTIPEPVTLTAGITNTFNLEVTNVTPPFHITRLRTLTQNATSYSHQNLPIYLWPGQSNYYAGVVSPDLPASNVVLSITGPGITVGPTIIEPNLYDSGLNFISAEISVASNAVPGLRSLIVTRTSDGVQAYALGFLEIRPLVPDFNFDGLSDLFQRQYFARFTAPEAAPDADPDGDHLVNRAEYIAGTMPTNAASCLRILSTTQTTNGAYVRWASVVGKRYQLYSRPVLSADNWQTVGSAFTATNAQTEYFDPAATNSTCFYRVQVMEE